MCERERKVCVHIYMYVFCIIHVCTLHMVHTTCMCTVLMCAHHIRCTLHVEYTSPVYVLYCISQLVSFHTGSTAYVLSVHPTGAGYLLWNPCTGGCYHQYDSYCPLASVGCMFNSYNVCSMCVSCAFPL